MAISSTLLTFGSPIPISHMTSDSRPSHFLVCNIKITGTATVLGIRSRLESKLVVMLVLFVLCRDQRKTATTTTDTHAKLTHTYTIISMVDLILLHNVNEYCTIILLYNLVGLLVNGCCTVNA